MHRMTAGQHDAFIHLHTQIHRDARARMNRRPKTPASHHTQPILAYSHAALKTTPAMTSVFPLVNGATTAARPHLRHVLMRPVQQLAVKAGRGEAVGLR
eukprot:365647-Chlamydomonas_euryale.AAC.9